MKTVTVPFVNLGAQFESLQQEFVDAFVRLGKQGAYILSDDVTQFEAGLAKLCQTKHAIGVGNGTDALILILKALDIGPGDEVITAPNSFIASAGAVAAVGAKVVFVDVGEDYNIDVNLIEAAITQRTKAIIPVHLTGNPADMTAINRIAKKHQLYVVEDAAQAIGAKHHGQAVGGLGDAAAFSLHPLKNLHLMGDAGFISTNNTALFETILRLRNHGLMNRNESALWGLNSRLDAIQAAFGNIKLPHFDRWTKRFQSIAQRYRDALCEVVQCPIVAQGNEAVYHNFVIQVPDRTQLMAYLADNSIETKIHYPIPLHLMEMSRSLGYQKGDFPVTEWQSERIVSLPIYPELSDEQVDVVCDLIKQYYQD